MVVLEDAEKLLEESRPKVEQDTLLRKYGIPIDHLEFSYVQKCKDAKELERMLQILRSGEEGYYPELMKTTEDRLAAIKPKSKLLRKISPVIKRESLDVAERTEITNDLQSWVTQITDNDRTLERYKNKGHKCDFPIRRAQETTEEKKTTSKRIGSTDYSSWDKYDPDTEILKMDLKEEHLKEEYAQSKKKQPQKTVQFTECNTEIECHRKAVEEKSKGNEFFKTGDYNEALHHYTASIKCKPTVECFTNRALVYLKLKKYPQSIKDCNSALNMEPNNVKALLRKSQGLAGAGNILEALDIVEEAIQIDPNNNYAQELAQKLRTQCDKPLRKTRFSIENVDNTSKHKRSKERKKIMIPIPGTSKMSPPYYVVCTDNSPENIRNETVRANTPSQILHLVSVDGSDDDSCTIDHLNRTGSKVEKCQSENEKPAAKTHKRNKVRIEDMYRTNRKPVTGNEAGGEPHTKSSTATELPDDINSPYSFLKTWNSARDKHLEESALILSSIDPNRLVDIIGCKLDSAMFSKLLKCLCVHFAVPGEVNRLYSILLNIVKVPRFDILAMLTSKEDKNNINSLVIFLKQHGKCLPQTVINKFYM